MKPRDWRKLARKTPVVRSATGSGQTTCKAELELEVSTTGLLCSADERRLLNLASELMAKIVNRQSHHLLHDAQDAGQIALAGFLTRIRTEEGAEKLACFYALKHRGRLIRYLQAAFRRALMSLNKKPRPLSFDDFYDVAHVLASDLSISMRRTRIMVTLSNISSSYPPEHAINLAILRLFCKKTNNDLSRMYGIHHKKISRLCIDGIKQLRVHLERELFD